MLFDLGGLLVVDAVGFGRSARDRDSGGGERREDVRVFRFVGGGGGLGSADDLSG